MGRWNPSLGNCQRGRTTLASYPMTTDRLRLIMLGFGVGWYEGLCPETEARRGA